MTSFRFIFGLFKQTLQWLYVRYEQYLVSGRIQTHNFFNKRIVQEVSKPVRLNFDISVIVYPTAADLNPNFSFIWSLSSTASPSMSWSSMAMHLLPA